MNCKKLLLCSLIIIIGITTGKAQFDESHNSMIWGSIGVSSKISKRWSVGFSHLSSVSIKTMDLNFMQSNIKIGYRLSRNWKITAGAKPSVSINEQGWQKMRHRLYGELKLNTRISKRIRMQNSLTAEHHFNQRSKFQQRYYLTNKLYYRNNKLPLKLRPYFTQKLYYYAGGRLLQYYDADGDKSYQVAPNGLHAYRAQFGIRLSITKSLRISAYHMIQKEFNTSLFNSNDINSFNPNSEKIRRPFYNFNVSAISISYSI